ncbi:hypothetical protein [Flagellimonas allohymeniacidonis]|uniref:Lipocalin-like domain-containing protein n=1 Tax=Flagellimonas allohymeniacidonis TaxID=2517819 RepID=A0A4Q8QIF5_9FLAO|nr:hypothetical protein [Allomuricauda hymeniacidonis]TAI48483.1 hypothetical protein EW142_01375 [Allomuricauda hymeniacidonis]
MTIFQRYSILIFLVCTCTVWGQGNKKEQTHPIVGSWTYDASTFEASLEQSSKRRLDTIPQHKLTIRGYYVGRTETFAPDGRYTITLADGSTLQAQWAAQNNNIVLVTTPSGDVFRKRISFPAPGRMVIESIASGNTKSVMNALHFIKN